MGGGGGYSADDERIREKLQLQREIYKDVDKRSLVDVY